MESLQRAEIIDNYRERVNENELNRIARSGQVYQTWKEPKEKEIKDLANRFEIVRGCELVFLHPSADAGFPHTRPRNIICMPSGFDGVNVAETILHEGFHIHQRNFPSLWKSYSIRQGWWPILPSEIPVRWRERCRINPDTMSHPFWTWQDNYVPLPLFTNEASPRLSECEIRWFDLRNGVLYKDAPRSFSERYGNIAQPEHPYEVGAIEFSKRWIQTYKEAANVLMNE